MSFTLYWRPVRPVQSYSLPIELKKRLGKRLWQHDGSLRSDPITLTNKDVAYLEGLADGGIPGASDLIEALLKNEQIEIYIDE